MRTQVLSFMHPNTSIATNICDFRRLAHDILLPYDILLKTLRRDSRIHGERRSKYVFLWGISSRREDIPVKSFRNGVDL